MSPLTTPAEAREFVRETGFRHPGTCRRHDAWILWTTVGGESEKRLNLARIASINRDPASFWGFMVVPGPIRRTFRMPFAQA